MKSYNELEIYTEISLMSKELRESIQQMKRYYRFDVGDEIRELLRHLKYQISDIHRKPNTCKYSLLIELLSSLDHLEIALSDCLEDGALKLEGRKLSKNSNERLIYVKKKVRVWYERFGMFQIYNGWSSVIFFTIKDNQRQYFHAITARLGNKRGSVERLFKKTPGLYYFYGRIGNVVKVAGSFDVDEKVLKGKIRDED